MFNEFRLIINFEGKSGCKYMNTEFCILTTFFAHIFCFVSTLFEFNSEIKKKSDLSLTQDACDAAARTLILIYLYENYKLVSYR